MKGVWLFPWVQFLQKFAWPLQILFILSHMVEVLNICQNPSYWVSHLKHFQTTLNRNIYLLSQHLLKWWAFPLVDLKWWAFPLVYLKWWTFPLVDSLMIMIHALFRTACIYIHKHIEIINGYQFIIRILSFHDLQLVYWFEQKCHRF